MRRDDRGQAAVELALVTPLLFVFLLVVVQVGLVVRDQVLVVESARAAARVAAVDQSDEHVVAAARVPGLDAARLRVRTERGTGPGATVRVEVAYDSEPDVPLLEGIAPAVRLTATAVLRIEV